MPTVSKQKLATAAIEKIEDKIYVVRGQRVMLDSDLAAVYQVETRVLKQAVRRNRNRFPVDFMFELSDEEVADLAFSRSQTVILKGERARKEY